MTDNTMRESFKRRWYHLHGYEPGISQDGMFTNKLAEDAYAWYEKGCVDRGLSLAGQAAHQARDAEVERLRDALQSAERIVAETDSPDGDLVYAKIAQALKPQTSGDGE